MTNSENNQVNYNSPTIKDESNPLLDFYIEKLESGKIKVSGIKKDDVLRDIASYKENPDNFDKNNKIHCFLNGIRLIEQNEKAFFEIMKEELENSSLPPKMKKEYLANIEKNQEKGLLNLAQENFEDGKKLKIKAREKGLNPYSYSPSKNTIFLQNERDSENDNYFSVDGTFEKFTVTDGTIHELAHYFHHMAMSYSATESYYEYELDKNGEINKSSLDRLTIFFATYYLDEEIAMRTTNEFYRELYDIPQREVYDNVKYGDTEKYYIPFVREVNDLMTTGTPTFPQTEIAILNSKKILLPNIDLTFASNFNHLAEDVLCNLDYISTQNTVYTYEDIKTLAYLMFYGDVDYDESCKLRATLSEQPSYISPKELEILEDFIENAEQGLRLYEKSHENKEISCNASSIKEQHFSSLHLIYNGTESGILGILVPLVEVTIPNDGYDPIVTLVTTDDNTPQQQKSTTTKGM